MFVWFLILYEKKSSITGSLVFALWYSDGLRRKRSALKQHYTNFTKVSKNKGSAFFFISDKSVPYLTLTSFPGVSMASVGQEGSPSPASLLLDGTTMAERPAHSPWVFPILCPPDSFLWSESTADHKLLSCVCLLWTQKSISSFHYKMEHLIKVWYNCFVREFALKMSWLFWSGLHACLCLHHMLISRMALFCQWEDK